MQDSDLSPDAQVALVMATTGLLSFSYGFISTKCTNAKSPKNINFKQAAKNLVVFSASIGTVCGGVRALEHGLGDGAIFGSVLTTVIASMTLGNWVAQCTNGYEKDIKTSNDESSKIANRV
jgi:hypothetical protein